MRKLHCTSINRKLEENSADFIKRSEHNYCEQIKAAADSIADSRKEKPIILLSGPSGAGKTTTALRLEEYLDNRGIETHTVSMDDYFLPIDHDTAVRDENGEIDYESPMRLDIPLLNEHMLKISNCEEIEIPAFDFSNQARKKGKPLKRRPGELVVFEGIHALNPQVTGMTDSFASCIYVSVRTRIETKTGALLHPSHIRLMRRIIRDKFFRGRAVESTIEMYKNVERGENRFIMPFKNRAEYSVDTFHPYELSVYKKFLYGDLKAEQDKFRDFDNYQLMLEVLDELDEIDIDSVPDDSLVREFIGGSRLNY
ncbi:nucleoside kinase [Ruminococcus sp. Marseille-P6503]|uniref:uridine kinase family protein n=1 Tax=Ruminococcus sp. Marseille-P6503 TaxID=2364796 RepID=UPI000F53AFF1|nr:nucleoside kinase [Ruminococcus sp. Marseille-P6503]